MNSHLIWFLLRVFIIRDNISIVIYVVSHHFIRFDSLDDRLNVIFLFKYLRRMVQVIRYESFDIKGCLFWRGGSNWCGNDSFEPKIWSGLYQRTLTNFMMTWLFTERRICQNLTIFRQILNVVKCWRIRFSRTLSFLVGILVSMFPL